LRDDGMRDHIMLNSPYKELNPEIVLGEADHRQLNILAMAGLNHTPDQADDLLYELERARVVADTSIPNDVVRMGSTVQYRTNTGQEPTVTVVYPVDADIAQGRISVMTPVGTALVGLSVGQSITWRSRDGRQQQLTVISVSQPAAAE
jgi:regulator of nucleoside diphosphate kinase